MPLARVLAALLLALALPLAARAEEAAAVPRFELDIQPILTSAGCNTGACHGKSRGQNGFQLSLLGFDDEFDFGSIAKEGRGRRVFPAAPDESLLLAKASARVPHGGGVRLPADGPAYAVVRRWIELGLPRVGPDDPRLVGIELDARERTLAARQTHPIRVTARFSDGSSRDVTRWCAFQSNEAPVAAVDATGLVRAGNLPGETSIMVRYRGHIATLGVSIPNPAPVASEVYARLPRTNFIDELVWRKLESLGVVPAPPAGDATYLRRVSLDLIGRLPTADEAREFLDDTRPDKRARLVDRLLARPEYADYWANQWADLLRPNPYRAGIKATLSFDTWIRDAFRRNQPYDAFVRDLLTAQGSTWRNGATVLYRDRRTPEELTVLTSQLFLGVRLDCARCHQHPFEVWGQADFYSLAAYFARVGRKGLGVSPPISGGEEMVFLAAKGSVTHPLTGQVMEPQPLVGEPPVLGPDDDPRAALAAWVTSAENPYFAQVAVNRVWAALLGRGLVEPVDDLRATNPPSNPALLAALADDFRQHGYDLKHLLRTITASQVYALASDANPTNVGDTRNYSRHYRQRLRAEVLLDAVNDVTGQQESFAAMPPGSRAAALWTHRVGSEFLDAFGRPDPNQDPPCERTGDTSVVQALHLMNAPALARKVSAESGLAARLAKADLPARAALEEAYLTIYSRRPTAEELAALAPVVDVPDAAARRAAFEDLVWALLNTPEFVFKD